MKNFKKLHKGMTLVEVIVAMSIFSIGAAAVTMAFSAAVKYNTYNQLRDEELAIQQTALQDGKSTGLEVYSGAVQNRELVFTNTVAKKKITFTKNPYKHITEYQAARSGKNDKPGTMYDFQLKTFSSTPLGSDKVTWNPADKKYKFVVTNKSSSPVDVHILIDGGTLYEGDYNNGGYKHSSDLYCSALAPSGTEYKISDDPEDSSATETTIAPSGFEVGYARDDIDTLEATAAPITFEFYKDGKVYQTFDVKVGELTGTECAAGWVNVEIATTGNVTYEYMSE